MGRLLYAVAAAAACCLPLAAQAAEPRASLQGDLDPALRNRIQQAVGESDRSIENRFEARRRARTAAEDAMAVLRSEGYYAAVVEPDVSEADPPRPLVRVTPGPRFLLGRAKLDWQGQPPDAPTAERTIAAIALSPGAPGRAEDIVAAEGRALATLRGRGYADAEAEPRDVLVDHADDSVTPTFVIAAGPLVRLDGIDMRTDGRTNLAWLRNLAPWTAGDAYNPTDVAELERRLLDTGVYQSVTVALAPPENATAAGERPVIVSLSERKRRTIEAGASYSTTEGFGLDTRWLRYNLLRRADTLTLSARLSTLDGRLGADLSLPHWRRADQTLHTGVSVYRLSTDAYDETGAGVRADVTRRYGKTSYVILGASVDAGRSTELTPGTLSTLGRDIVTFAGLGEVRLDRSDDPLAPRRGWRVSGRLEPTVIVGETNLPYLRVVVQGSAYQSLDKAGHTVVAERVRVGRIINGTLFQIPASQRFYAGGGGSVRGFGYQGVGPQLSDGTPQGGLSLFESSAEVRRDLTPHWGVAGFVDAGAIGSNGPVDFRHLAVGAGVGVIYTLGIVPIRVDVATPVSNRRGAGAFQLYISIGQSF